MKKRIIGVDVARALAVFGMVIVNFKLVLGGHGSSWLRGLVGILEGKAAATFVVLAGIGIGLITRSAFEDQAKMKGLRIRMIKRATILFICGLSYIVIWPADILHFYGVYMIITLFFINKSDSQIILGVVGITLAFPLLLLTFDYEQGWDFKAMEYQGFWTFNGFIRNLFYNGFHPVIPWTAFMLYGLWLGRQGLHRSSYVKRIFWTSLVVFISTQSVSWILMKSVQEEDAIHLLSTSPMPPMPFYMLSGISVATFVIASCIRIGRRYSNSILIGFLSKTGQLALTFYVAHVLIGMGWIDTFGNKQLGDYSIRFTIQYALFFCTGCIAFAIIWLRFRQVGPLEWVIRKLTE